MNILHQRYKITESQAMMAAVDPENTTAEMAGSFGEFIFDRYEDLYYSDEVTCLTGHVRWGGDYYKTEVEIFRPGVISKLGAKLLRKQEPNSLVEVNFNIDSRLTPAEFFLQRALNETPSLPLDD